LSRMTGNRHVRFLERRAPVMGSGHSVIAVDSMAADAGFASISQRPP
jgi:hypothetical protein